LCVGRLRGCLGGECDGFLCVMIRLPILRGLEAMGGEGFTLMRDLIVRCKDRNGTFTVETTAWEGSGGVK